MKRMLSLLSLLCLSLATLAQRQAGSPVASPAPWVGTFATAPEFTGPSDMPQHVGLSGNTLRQAASA